MKQMTGKGARKKGHDYERRIAVELRELGFTDCRTSRYSSKMLDEAGVDLVNTDPFSFQIKAVESGISYHRVLSEMQRNCNLNVILHKRNRKEVAVFTKEDFYELIAMLKTNKIL